MLGTGNMMMNKTGNIESVKVMCMLVWGKKFTRIKQGEKKTSHEEVPGAYKSTYSGHLT